MNPRNLGGPGRFSLAFKRDLDYLWAETMPSHVLNIFELACMQFVCFTIVGHTVD